MCASQIALSLVAYDDNSTGYLTHYAYAYLAGPWIGGAIAGIFHNIYIKMFDSNRVDDESHGNDKGHWRVNLWFDLIET